jgi:hypothetical protein
VEGLSLPQQDPSSDVQAEQKHHPREVAQHVTSDVAWEKHESEPSSQVRTRRTKCEQKMFLAQWRRTQKSLLYDLLFTHHDEYLTIVRIYSCLL